MLRAGALLPRFIPGGVRLPAKTLGVPGLAVAAVVGVVAALSWSVWIWTAFSSAPSEAVGRGAPVASESKIVTDR